MRRKKRPNGKSMNLRLQGIEWKLDRILSLLYSRQKTSSFGQEKTVHELIEKMSKAAKDLEEMAANEAK